MELRRAHAEQRDWEYDQGAWSAALMRMSLVAPTQVATEIDELGRAINISLDQVERGRKSAKQPLSSEEFEQARKAPAAAQIRLVNAIRRSLSGDRAGLPFGIGD